MKREFQVGDRVAAYDTCGGYFGTIETIDSYGHIKISGYQSWYHPKQCRRLIPPKKRREIWLELKTFKETLAGHATRLHWSTIQLNGYARFVEAKKNEI